MRNPVLHLLRRFGHRGSALAGFAVLCLAYGAGLLSGYTPTFSVAYHYSTFSFGVTFVVVGLFIPTGIIRRFRRYDNLHYAVGEIVCISWGLLLCTHWTQPHGWSSGLSWLGLALALILGQVWPELPRPLKPPKLPTLRGPDQ